jgi:tRNA (Thr-GGU) A37 N-methylase
MFGDAREKAVFASRSPDRPNPVGLHRVSVLEVVGRRLRIAPMEAIDGAPVVDIKPVLVRSDDQWWADQTIIRFCRRVLVPLRQAIGLSGRQGFRSCA